MSTKAERGAAWRAKNAAPTAPVTPVDDHTHKIGEWVKCTRHDASITSIWIAAGAGERGVQIYYAKERGEVIPIRGVLEYAYGDEWIIWYAEMADGTLHPLPEMLQEEVQKVHRQWRKSYVLPMCPYHREERLRCVCGEAVAERWHFTQANKAADAEVDRWVAESVATGKPV